MRRCLRMIPEGSGIITGMTSLAGCWREKVESEKVMYQLVISKILMEYGVELILVVEHMVIH